MAPEPIQPANRAADLVLEGGGVKGNALVGVAAFEEAGYRFNRVAGTSAGAMVAAMLAAGSRPHTSTNICWISTTRGFATPLASNACTSAASGRPRRDLRRRDVSGQRSA